MADRSIGLATGVPGSTTINILTKDNIVFGGAGSSIAGLGAGHFDQVNMGRSGTRTSYTPFFNYNSSGFMDINALLSMANGLTKDIVPMAAARSSIPDSVPYGFATSGANSVSIGMQINPMDVSKMKVGFGMLGSSGSFKDEASHTISTDGTVILTRKGLPPITFQDKAKICAYFDGHGNFYIDDKLCDSIDKPTRSAIATSESTTATLLTRLGGGTAPSPAPVPASLALEVPIRLPASSQTKEAAILDTHLPALRS